MQDQFDYPENQQNKQQGKSETQDDEVAGFALAEIAGTVLAALHTKSRGNHALQHLPKAERLVRGRWFVLFVIHMCALPVMK